MHYSVFRHHPNTQLANVLHIERHAGVQPLSSNSLTLGACTCHTLCTLHTRSSSATPAQPARPIGQHSLDASPTGAACMHSRGWHSLHAPTGAACMHQVAQPARPSGRHRHSHASPTGPACMHSSGWRSLHAPRSAACMHTPGPPTTPHQRARAPAAACSAPPACGCGTLGAPPPAPACPLRPPSPHPPPPPRPRPCRRRGGPQSAGAPLGLRAQFCAHTQCDVMGLNTSMWWVCASLPVWSRLGTRALDP